MKAQLRILGLLFVAIFIIAPNEVLASKKISYFPSATSDFSNLDKSSYEYTPSKAGGYGESFYLNSYDANGNVVTALISITNYNPFSKGMGSFDIHWVENDKVRVIHEEFDADEIQKDSLKGTMFGKSSYIKVDTDTTKISYQGEDTDGNHVDISIDMKHTEAGAQSGDSKLYMGKGKSTFWGLKIIAPRGEVVARLKTAKDRTSTLKLDGYLDHGNATAKVPDFSDHWYRLIFFSKNWTIDLHETTTKFKYGKRKPQMLYVAKNHQAIGMFSDWEYKEADFKEHSDSPYAPPTGWTLKLERDDIKINGTVNVTKEVVTVDVLDSVSWAIRMLVKAFYSNAWQHYFLVDVDLTIEQNGVKENVSGLGMATAEYY